MNVHRPNRPFASKGFPLESDLAAKVEVETKPTIGILGGGQLAWMLAEASLGMGIETRILASHQSETATKAFPESLVSLGGLSNQNRMNTFFSKIDIATFESELVSLEILRNASDHCHAVILPDLSAVQYCQNKIRQKQLFEELNLPSSPWIVCPDDGEPAFWLEKMFRDLGSDCILKWAEGGYDGLGIWSAKSNLSEAENIKLALNFISQARARGAEVYAEARAHFSQELAIVASCSRKGEMVFYPLVISEQQNGTCWKVTGPAIDLGVPRELEIKAQNFAKTIADRINYCGTFALEFFALPTGELLINEMAPRVHNSGHYSLDACPGSQFENHIRAITGLAFRDTSPKHYFGMLNLLGPDHNPSFVPDIEKLDLDVDSNLYWYGKAESRPRRKLGHINVVAETPTQLEAKLQKIEYAIQKWQQT